LVVLGVAMAMTVVIGVTGVTGITGITETTGISVIMGALAATEVAATGMAGVGTKPLRSQARSQGSWLSTRI